MWQIITGLSVTILAICLATPFMKRRKAPRFVTGCMFVAGCGLAISAFGNIVDAVTGIIPQAVLGLIVAGMTLVFGIGLYLDLKDGKPDKQAQWIALGLPLLLILLPGAVGAQTKSIVENVGNGAKNVVSQTTN